ncbi:hypothetical protein EMMF5_003240 [Cystobasidiomycetes sp. EMM_F5]
MSASINKLLAAVQEEFPRERLPFNKQQQQQQQAKTDTAETRLPSDIEHSDVAQDAGNASVPSVPPPTAVTTPATTPGTSQTLPLQPPVENISSHTSTSTSTISHRRSLSGGSASANQTERGVNNPALLIPIPKPSSFGFTAKSNHTDVMKRDGVVLTPSIDDLPMSGSSATRRRRVEA